MSDSQQRRGFDAPRAWSGDITGAAIAALSDVAEARQKPAVASSHRDATPDAAIVSALAHGALAASGGESVDETAIAAAPAGVGVPRLRRTSRPGPNRTRCATGSSSKPSSTCRRRR